MPARISDVSLDGINRQLGLLDTRLTEVAEQFDALRRGDLAFAGDVDLGGNRLTNTDAAQSDDDALTLGELLDRLDDLEDEAAQLETSAAEDYAGGGRQKRLLRRTSRLKDQISDEVANIVSALGFPAVVFTQDDGAGNAELATDTVNFVWDDTNDRLGIGIAVPLAALHIVEGTDDAIRAVSGANELFSVGQTETVVNEAGLSSHDFRVEGITLTNLLFVDASTERIGSGTAAPVDMLDFRRNVTGGVRVQNSTGGAPEPRFLGVGSRGTVGTETQTQADDFLVTLEGRGYTDAPAVTGTIASLRLQTREALTAGSQSTRILASVTKTSATSPTEALRIDGAEGVVCNDTGDAAFDFRVEGDTLTHLVFVDASADRVGIGDSTPDNFFTVGTTSQFQVGSDGDLDRIKDVPYSWPAANAVGALNNDGAGTLSWAAPTPAAHNLLSAQHGDTVTNTVTRGSLVYGNVTPAWDELVIGAANRVLRSDGTDVAWAQVVLTTDVTGTLPVGNGGTGSTAFTAGSVIFSNGTILTQDNAELFWDNTNDFLGIGTATPSQELHVVGDALVTGILYGGTAAGDNLDLDPSSASNYTGSVRVGTTASDFGTTPATGLDLFPNGFTVGLAIGTVSGARLTSTITQDADSVLGFPVVSLLNAAYTYQNASGITLMSVNTVFNATPTINNAQGSAVTSGGFRGFLAGPLLRRTGGSTLTLTTGQAYGFQSLFDIGASTTAPTWVHFGVGTTVLGGTLTTETVLDCGTLRGATQLTVVNGNTAAQMRHAGAAVFGANTAVTAATTLEVAASATSSLRNSTRTIFPPTANQVIDAAADTILANATFVNLTNTTGAPIVLTSAPTIANGEDGMYLIIMNIAADSISLQDQGTLAGSNLRLGAVARVLGTRDSLILLYSSDIGDWVEVSFNNVI